MTATATKMEIGEHALAGTVQSLYAFEIEIGDVLLLPASISRVDRIETYDLAVHKGDPVRTSSIDGRWPVLKFSGQVNAVRFPHERVSVIRSADLLYLKESR